jgi:hypothetical protein
LPINHKFKYSIAIVAILKDESKYIEEWIEFHIKNGVQHFYLYDNESTDETRSILASYGEDLITVTDWPSIYGNGGQTLALAHCIGLFRDVAEWMLHIDIDEFLFIKNKKSLFEFLQENKDISALLIPWRCFGPSGHQLQPQGGVLENYIQMADLSKAPDKLFYELTRTKSLFKAHQVWDVRVHGCITIGKSVDDDKDLLLNHYITKSKVDFYDKIARAHPWSNTKLLVSWRQKRFLIFNFLDKNFVEDFAILDKN